MKIYWNYNLRISLETECASGLIACRSITFYAMNSQLHCIKVSNRCDGQEDSPNGTDEDGCCSKDQFTCNKDVEANATNFLEQECISIIIEIIENWTRK